VFAEFRNASRVYTERFVVLVRASDGGSMLRRNYLDQVLQVKNRGFQFPLKAIDLQVHHFLSREFQVTVTGGLVVRHADLCRPLCDVNKALDAIQVQRHLLAP
jgi:hypothetical protein